MSKSLPNIVVFLDEATDIPERRQAILSPSCTDSRPTILHCRLLYATKPGVVFHSSGAWNGTGFLAWEHWRSKNLKLVALIWRPDSGQSGWATTEGFKECAENAVGSWWGGDTGYVVAERFAKWLPVAT